MVPFYHIFCINLPDTISYFYVRSCSAAGAIP
nr:MAG TPA: Cytochrome c oxidase assembly protein [Bacteriophage sp.]